MTHDSQTTIAGTQTAGDSATDKASVLPTHRDHYYGGAWHPPASAKYFGLSSPGTGQSLGHAADGSAADVDAAVECARQAFPMWRDVPPLERAKALRRFAGIVREHA